MTKTIEDIVGQYKPVPPMAEQQKILDFFSNGIRGRLPEKLFRQNFLAFFCKETPTEFYGQYVNNWMAISGGPSSETELIDDMGRVTITIPPIYNTSIAYNSIDWNTDRSFLMAISQHDLQANNNTMLATNEFRKALMAKVSNNQVPSIDRYIQQKWVEVYKYFGKPHLAAIIEKELYGTSGPNNNTLQTGGMEFEFE